MCIRLAIIWRVVARKCFHYHSLINYTNTHTNTSACSISFQLLQTEILTTAWIQTNQIITSVSLKLFRHILKSIHACMFLLYLKIQGTCLLASSQYNNLATQNSNEYMKLVQVHASAMKQFQQGY